MKKGHRTSLAVGLAVLFLLIAFLLVPHFLKRDMSESASNPPDMSQSLPPGEQGGTSEAPAVASAGSTLAFTFDLDSSNPQGGSASEGADPGAKSARPEAPGAMAGAEAGGGTGGSNFGDVLLVGSTGSTMPFGVGPGGGGTGPGGGRGGDTGGGPGSTPPGNTGPSNDDGPLSNGPGGDEPQLVSDWQPPGGGVGGPIPGGGGPGGGPAGGGPGGGGPGGSGGPGGGPNGGVDDPDRFFPANDPGDSTGGPSIATPIPTGDGTVPVPPTAVLLVGGLGLLWGARKIGQAAKRS